MYLGPDDRWPRHSRPRARAALEVARSAGWWFRPAEGHTFGRLRCLPPGRDADRQACIVPVYSTSGADDGSDTARVIHDAVRKCPHDRDPERDDGPDPETAARIAAGTLAQLGALVEAAEALLTTEVAVREANEAIDDALDQLADDNDVTTDDLDERVARLERRAFVSAGEAYSAASRAGVVDRWPPQDGARELLRLAKDGLQDAVGLVVVAAGSDDAQKVAAQCDRLQVRLNRLSGLLGEAH
jgi:hypothetical protein